MVYHRTPGHRNFIVCGIYLVVYCSVCQESLTLTTTAYLLNCLPRLPYIWDTDTLHLWTLNACETPPIYSAQSHYYCQKLDLGYLSTLTMVELVICKVCG